MLYSCRKEIDTVMLISPRLFAGKMHVWNDITELHGAFLLSNDDLDDVKCQSLWALGLQLHTCLSEYLAKPLGASLWGNKANPGTFSSSLELK